MSRKLGDITVEIAYTTSRSVINQQEPPAHPKNCKHECPYGRNRAFCWPCMAKIMAEHKAAKEGTPKED